MRCNDIKKFARGERGVETIEVAVVLPLMLLVMFAGFEYGWALLKSIQVDHAARVGMPGQEFYPVVTTVVVRPDPAASIAA